MRQAGLWNNLVGVQGKNGYLGAFFEKTEKIKRRSA